MDKGNKKLNPLARMLNKFNRKSTKDKRTAQITIAICATLDTLCFGLLFYATGYVDFWLLIGAIGLISALVTNLLSYVCGDFGLGQIIAVMPKQHAEETKIKEIVEQVKDDKNVAWFIFLTMFVVVVGAQTFLAYLKYDQIAKDTIEWEEKHTDWKKTMESPDFQGWEYMRQQLHIENEPKNPVGTVDWIVLILPILTTIGSFVIGVKCRGRYDGIEKLYDEACANITDWEATQDDEEKGLRSKAEEKIKGIEDAKKEKLEELEASIEQLHSEAKSIIGRLDDLGELKGRLYAALLEAIEDGDKQTSYFECRNKLVAKIKSQAPTYYGLDVRELNTSLGVVEVKIIKDLQPLVFNTQLHKMEKEKKFADRLKKLKDETNIFRTIKGA